MASEIKGPNGLAFSPDERTLYIVEGRETPRRLLAFEVLGDGNRLGKRRIFAVADDGGALDGFRCDEDGNLWCGWGMGSAELDGVVVFSPAGERIGRIALPERCANLCFGGAPQPVVHGGKPFGLFAICKHAWLRLKFQASTIEGRDNLWPSNLDTPSRLPAAFTSLDEFATRHIREMIVKSELGPGARLHEQALSEALGNPRTPVREAIRALAAEGLVEAD